MVMGTEMCMPIAGRIQVSFVNETKGEAQARIMSSIRECWNGSSDPVRAASRLRVANESLNLSEHPSTSQGQTHQSVPRWSDELRDSQS